ncbi:hypothetical protein MNV49_003691 [Pseudohyphozyma bogoriensis]|nr:hypothetical protein MNV49_003691 [Pseudohyphozyma bogoriensis]
MATTRSKAQAQAQATANARARSNSLKDGLAQVPLASQSAPPTNEPVPPVTQLVKDVPAASFLSDLKTFRWTTNPASSLKLILVTLVAWAAIEYSPVQYFTSNPLTPAIFISYPLPVLPGDHGVPYYTKGFLDIAFLAFYIVVFSFIRQGIMEYLLRPLARWSGLKSEAKQTRFMEQAYAVVYNVLTGALGLHAMYHSKMWYYKTEHFWLEYPHWRMTRQIKWYYLLQAAYWLQQMIVLGLRLEKPRSDYYQLIVHHIVTLWLIGWSYLINLTMIGVAIFISMDIPEIFLAGSKCLNYVGLQHCSEVSFVCLLGVWTYMRHYLNCIMLWSVWYEYDLIPAYHRNWTHAPGNTGTGPASWWVFTSLSSGRIPHWMKYQIAIPIFLLQCVNAFWSYLLWRIAFRLVTGVTISDTREEGEDDDDEAAKKEEERKRQ